MDAPLPDWPHCLSAYEPQRTISTGRVSTVVHARESATGRDVAIKILHDHLAAHPTVRRRLRREFAAVRRLEHPRIVVGRELIEAGETLALVMDHVQGSSLRQWVEEHGPMPWPRAKTVIDDVLAAIDHAHTRGIWHRDLNAEHILIDDDHRAFVVGFGIARVDELAALTTHTQALGALEAMAPERLLGLAYDGRADLYSVGAVAHELLVGHPPSAGTMKEAFSRANADDHQSLPDDLPEAARYLLERSLVGDVAARFATARQMRRVVADDGEPDAWRGWISRRIPRCTNCSAPVIPSLASCPECGHDFSRLIEDRDGGEWAVEVISPRHDATINDWFANYLPSDSLGRRQFEALMELLEEYDDTRQFADWSFRYRWPPYVLADQISEDDAQRIASELKRRQIPHRAFRRPSNPLAKLAARLRLDRAAERVIGIDDELSTGPGAERLITWFVFFLFILPIMATINLARRHPVATAITFLTLIPLIILGSNTLGMGDQHIQLLALAYAGGLFGVQLIGRWAQRLGRSGETTTRGAVIALDELEKLPAQGAGFVLSQEITAGLREIRDQSVRQEVHDVLALVVTVSEFVDEEHFSTLEALAEEVLQLGQRLHRATERLDRHTTAALCAELESVELRIARGGDDDAEQLQERRQKLLNAMDTHDAAALEAMMLRASMQRLRGALLDHLEGESTLSFDDEVVLSLDDSIDEAIEEVDHQLEISRQVATL